MTLSIIGAFIGCWTPYFVVHLIHIWSEYQYSIADSVYALAETLALFNSAINPVLYGCFNVNLKRGLTEVCCPLRVRQQVTYQCVYLTQQSQWLKCQIRGISLSVTVCFPLAM